jgi:hypothetical protein
MDAATVKAIGDSIIQPICTAVVLIAIWYMILTDDQDDD